MTLPGSIGGGSDFGPSPVLTPDQLTRVRLAAARSPYYTQDGVAMRVRVISAVAVTVSVFVRQGTLDGNIQPHRFDVPAPGDRSVTILDFDMSEGLIFNVVAQVTQGAPLIGQTYVAAQLGIGTGATFTPLQAFLGDVVTNTQIIGWPGSTIQHSVDTEPVVRTIVGTSPAAGAEWTETVPTGARWELLSIHSHFVASATVSNRVPNLEMRSGANKLWSTALDNIIQASRAADYYFSQNLPFLARSSNVTVNVPIPLAMRLLAGQAFGSNTDVLQVGDQYSAPVYTVREWQEGS